MKTFNIILTSIVILVLGGFIFLGGSFTSQSDKPESEPLSSGNQEARQQGTSQVDEDNSNTDTEEFVDKRNYLNYSEENLEYSKDNGKTLLFFAATLWCQTCSVLEEEIIERNNEVPSDITILKVDYDNNHEMNSKYEVTVQHTLVLLDENGEEIDRWIGGGLDTLLAQVEKSEDS